MKKSITTTEYRVFLDQLRKTRKQAGITQVELAQQIDETQSFVSKVERGELRLDIIQLRTVCIALGSDLPGFVGQLEVALASAKRSNKRR